MIRWGLAVVALVAITLAVLLAILQLTSDSRTDVTDLDVGSCFDLDIGETSAEVVEITLVDPVDCGEPHNAQVVAVGDLNPDHDLAYPPDTELFARVDAACLAVATDARFGVVSIAPTEATWDGRRGRYLCVAVVLGGQRVVGDHGALAADGA